MIDFTKLNPEFVPLLQQLISNMEGKGHTVNAYYGFRSLDSQAKIYRRSRSTVQINMLLDELKKNGATYAASVMESVGPQPTGSWGTDTYLYSQHLIGEACDMFIDGDMKGGDVYNTLASEAIKLGLTPGRNFTHQDSGHIQYRAIELSKTYTMAQMDSILKGLNNG